MKPYLSKTDIISYIRCPLKLWLDVNKPEAVANDDASPMVINGEAAGERAREQFAGGIMINWKSWKSAVHDTKALMLDKEVHTIYEATFLVDQVLVRCDIMTRTNEGAWNLIEVKSTTKVEKHHILDVAIQKFILEREGIVLSSTMLMYIDKTFTFQGDTNYPDLFMFEDVADKCSALYKTVAVAIKGAHEVVIKKTEPVSEMAPKCKRQFVCGSKKYCEGLAPSDHISFLPRGGKVQEKLAMEGLTRITEIPFGLLKSETHIKVYDITVAGHELYVPGAREIIEALPYPRHFLDFESIQFSVPKWKGVRAWRQVPFQWSDHVQHENGEESYEKFLDVSGNDPRRAFADALVSQCSHDEGAVLVYNAAFERMIMMDLIVDFPDIAAELESIRARCFDLLPIMKNHYYHPDMKGSWSIKKVLSSFVPDMNYADLDEVSNGTEAQVAYMNLIDPDWTGNKVTLKHNALEYCKYDTLSMVKLVEGIYAREGV